MLTPRTANRLDFMARFGVEWLDPTADRKLLERLLTFPLHIFRVGNRPRGLARELGRGRLPDSVRLRRTRAGHFPDQTAWFAQRPVDYRRAFHSLRDCAGCAAFLDLPALEVLLETLCAGSGSPAQAMTMHRALDTGLFAAALESGQGIESGQSPGAVQPTASDRDSHNRSDVPTQQMFA